MRVGLFILGGLAPLLASCEETGRVTTSTVPSEEAARAMGERGSEMLVDSLIDRFDAPACEDNARVVGTMRKTNKDSVEMVRAYSATTACIDAVEQGMRNIGFTSEEQGVYRYSSESGFTEVVSTERIEGEPRGGIQWEIVER